MNDSKGPSHRLLGPDDGGREQDGPGSYGSGARRGASDDDSDSYDSHYDSYDESYGDDSAAAAREDEEDTRTKVVVVRGLDPPLCPDIEPEPFRTWFEPSKGLGHVVGVRTVRLDGYVEFALRGGGSGTCRSSNNSNSHNNDNDTHSSRSGGGRQAQSLRGLVEALGRDAACKLIFDQGLRERASRGNRLLNTVLWLSPRTYVSNGANPLSWESDGRIKTLWKVAPHKAPFRCFKTYYCCGLDSPCPDDDIPSTILSLFAGRGSVKLSADSDDEESAVSPWALKELVRTGAPIPLDVTFQGEFPGLSTDQWMDIMGSCHPSTRLCFTNYKGNPCTWSRGLVEAMRQSRTPNRIMVIEFRLLGPLAGATEALARCTSLVELHVQEDRTSGRRGTEAMLAAVAANRSLKVLGVDYVLTSTEWDRLWDVAASHPTLRSIRFNYWNVPARSTKGDPPGFDRLRSVETAVRSNERLTTVATIQCDAKEELSRILALVRSNRVATLSKEDEAELGRSWRHRLVSVAIDRFRSKDRKKKYEAAAFC
jgi:hypothetical protein